MHASEIQQLRLSIKLWRKLMIKIGKMDYSIGINSNIYQINNAQRNLNGSFVLFILFKSKL